MRTFAAPFEKRVLEKGISEVCFWGFSRKAKEEGGSYLVVMTDWRKKPDKEKPKKKRGNKKFIEKTDLLYKKQVPRNTIYREALILLLEL